MAYDEVLAERVREVVDGEPGLREKRMFGGLGFVVDGNLAVSVSGQGGLLVRVDRDQGPSLVDEPLVVPFEMHGRSMAGWLHVDGQALATDADLTVWVDRGLAHARSLPSK